MKEDDPSAEAFIAEARRYCALIEGRDLLTRDELVVAAQCSIAALYASALALRQSEPTDTPDDNVDMSTEEWMLLFRGLCEQLQDYDAYSPYSLGEQSPEADGSSLADDLADVYRDLRGGLRAWDLGNHADALWGWKFGVQAHWGVHALNALRAIHRIVTSRGLEAPSLNGRVHR